MKSLPEELTGPFVAGVYDRTKAALYLKRPDGQHQYVPDVYPGLFIPRPQMDRFPGSDFPEIFLNSVDEGRYFRVNMKPGTRRTQIDEVLDACKEEKVYPREADVSPIRRWFSDTGALVANKTKALFFDLETKPELIGFDDEAKKQHRIISWAAADKDGNTWFDYNETNNEEGEARIIKSFVEVASDYDTLLAWNGNDYDFYVLRWRSRILDLKIDWREWNLLDYMLVVKKALMSLSDPKFKRSFALDNIGKNVLDIQKLHVNCPMDQLDRLIEEDRVTELQMYNERDVEIMIKLDEKREFLDLHLAVCSLCRTFPGPGSLFPNTLADGLMLRLAVKEDSHFRSRYSDIEEDDLGKFPGAYVMDAELGFHSQVQVIDFSSLYPSIMISWNMSPETKLWTNRRHDEDVWNNAAVSACDVRFRTDKEGLLPMALRTLLETRKIYAEKQKKAKVGTEEWKRYGHESTALKVVANSMYGLLGSRYSRYYDRDIAQSVTLTGQMLIKECIEFSNGLGLRVIGADTDSNFVLASEEEAANLVRQINEILIPNIIKRQQCRTNTVKMDSDKGYHHLLIQAKKKYAGKLSTHKGRPAPDDMEPEIKGLEFQRSDQIKFAQRMQMHFVHFLLNPKANPIVVQAELHKWSDKFLLGDIPREDIEITQGVKKKPEEYVNMTPAVRVAQQMIDDGKEFYPGMKVPYIIVQTDKERIVKCIHADDYVGNFDRMYYWINKVLPPVSRLIEVRFPGEDLSEMLTLAKSPGQYMFDFQEVKQGNQMPQPQPKKHKSKIRIAKRYLIVKEEHQVETIKGLAALIKSSEQGTNRICIRIKMNNGDEADITTKHYVNVECLETIKEMFPWVEIK